MKKGMLFFLLAAVSFGSAFAQNDTVRLRGNKQHKIIVTDRAPQAAYFQLGGSAPFISINYDRRFSNRVNGLGFTAGAGFYGASGISVFSIPVSINYLAGHSTHFIEFAGGVTFITATAKDFFDDSRSSGSGFIYHLNAGYRYQPTSGGFFFRGGFSPLFAGGDYVTSFYLGFGHNF